MSLSMSLIQGTGALTDAAGANPAQAVLAAAAAATVNQSTRNYYHSSSSGASQLSTQESVQPDRPIGYGAFGVVWYIFLISYKQSYSLYYLIFKF